MTWRCESCKKRAGGFVGFFTGRKRSKVKPELCRNCSWDYIEAMSVKSEKYYRGDYVYKLERVAKYAEILLYELSKVSSYSAEEMVNLQKALAEFNNWE
jgi:hypothetical protein